MTIKIEKIEDANISPRAMATLPYQGDMIQNQHIGRVNRWITDVTVPKILISGLMFSAFMLVFALINMAYEETGSLYTAIVSSIIVAAPLVILIGALIWAYFNER